MRSRPECQRGKPTRDDHQKTTNQKTPSKLDRDLTVPESGIDSLALLRCAFWTQYGSTHRGRVLGINLLTTQSTSHRISLRARILLPHPTRTISFDNLKKWILRQNCENVLGGTGMGKKQCKPHVLTFDEAVKKKAAPGRRKSRRKDQRERK